MHLARVLIAHGAAPEADERLGRAVALRLHNPEAGVHIALGKLLLQQGKVTEAVGCYEMAVAAAPDLALARSNLGDAL